MKESGYLNSSGGIGFVGLLTIVFIILKLTGVIQWSWWWVLSPIWMTIVLVVLCVAIVVAAEVAKDRPW